MPGMRSPQPGHCLHVCVGADESVSAIDRARIRTEVARDVFRTEHGRDPIDDHAPSNRPVFCVRDGVQLRRERG